MRRIIDSRYELLNKVGSGGMADVYRARDLKTDEIVAVKLMHQELLSDSEFVRRFEREAQAQSMLNHENIVRTLGYGQDGNVPYIVMEYVNGITLKEYILRHAPLDQTTLTDIAMQILSALDHAHMHGVVHRDIKPQNVLMDRDGVLKVTDFGLAKAASSATITMTGSNVLGSVHYFSPEQARGIASDERSDLYSLGIIMYEMATATLPYEGDTPVTVALKHLQDLPIWPHLQADVPPALEEVILKSILKEPGDRYQSARQMSDDLARAMAAPRASIVSFPEYMCIATSELDDQELVDQAAEEMDMRPQRSTRKRIAISGVLAVVFFAALLAIIWTLVQHNASRVMPSVKNTQIDRARELIAEAGLKEEQIRIVNEDDQKLPKDFVISQQPEEGTQVDKDAVITLVVSNGPGETEVPYLIGMSLEEAEAQLESHFLKAGEPAFVVSDEPAYTVLEQSPQAGDTVEKGTEVSLTLSIP